MAECDAVGAGGRTAAAVAAAAGRGDGDDGGAVAAAAERDGDAVADGGHDVDGGQEAADTSCSAKKCPSWVRRCLRAPTYLLGNEVNRKERHSSTVVSEPNRNPKHIYYL